MRSAFVLVVLLAGCGRSEMSLEGLPVALTSEVDAGVPDAGLPDSGAVDAGMWCAPSSARCLADGWQYGVPGRCCNSRQTCKVSGRYTACEY